MRYLLILLNFCFIISAVQAQQSKDNVISVTANGEVELPADIIQFNINLNAEADTPQQAYNFHKKRETVLVQLLDKYKVQEDNIRFQPISINSRYTDEYINRKRKQVFQTSQQVSLNLKDFDTYEKIQVTLIENGFDQFSGRFLSSDQEEGEDEALRQAIQAAKDKATIIAEESNLQLGKIKSINYRQNQYRPSRQRESMAMRADSPGLMEYDQTVVLQASVTMEFSIK